MKILVKKEVLSGTGVHYHKAGSLWARSDLIAVISIPTFDQQHFHFKMMSVDNCITILNRHIFVSNSLFVCRMASICNFIFVFS